MLGFDGRDSYGEPPDPASLTQNGTLRVVLDVTGIPVTQGSVQAFRGRVVAVSPKLDAWRKTIIAAAHATLGPKPEPITGPVIVDLWFFLPRPKAHFRTGRYADMLRADAPTWPIYKNDKDKHTRAVYDALTLAGVWKDDGQAVAGHAIKLYDARPGVHIRIKEIE